MSKEQPFGLERSGLVTSKEMEETMGVYCLEPSEFDRVVNDLLHPTEPTDSIKRGAELLRKLYGTPRT